MGDLGSYWNTQAVGLPKTKQKNLGASSSTAQYKGFWSAEPIARITVSIQQKNLWKFPAFLDLQKDLCYHLNVE